MSQDINLTSLFIKTKLNNTDESGNFGDPAFQTTDTVYLKACQEIDKKKMRNELRPLSSFADEITEEKLATPKYTYPRGRLLRSCSDDRINTLCFDNDDYNLKNNPSIKTTNSEGRNMGASVVINIDLEKFEQVLGKTDKVKLITKKNNLGETKHYIEMGEYIGGKVDESLQTRLDKAFNNGYLQDGLECTGRVYTSNVLVRTESDVFFPKLNPEFTYNGEKYVRVSSIESLRINSLNYCWHKVEPVSLEIQNWENLPQSINPQGVKNGEDKQIKTETETCVITDIPFNLRNSLINQPHLCLWQNSIIRAFLNSAKSSELDGNPKFRTEQKWDFSKTGFLNEAFDLTREPLREFVIPNGEEFIKPCAFAGCVGLKRVVIPSSVYYICVDSFEDCNNLQLEFKNHRGFQGFLQPVFAIKFKYIYFSKNENSFILSPYKDEELEKTHVRLDYNEDKFEKYFNSNYTKNLVKINLLKEEGKIKYIPPEYTLYNFPASEIDKYFLNNNNRRWGNLVKTLKFDTLSDDSTKFNLITDLMKIYYAIGGFSENQGECEKAFDYILKYVAVSSDPKENAENIHSRFSGIKLNGPYNPQFAKFFMKYYKDNPDFMRFNLDSDLILLNSNDVVSLASDAELSHFVQNQNIKFKNDNGIDYLCPAHNSFDNILKNFPNKVVGGNEKKSLLSPLFVAAHCIKVDYENIDAGNEDLANLVGVYGYSQASFDEIQDIFNKAKKVKANSILCADKPKDKHITFRILEKDDPTGFIIGDITNCCQRVGDLGQSCVADGYTNPNSGFLVFEETLFDEDGKPTGKTRLLGQAYIWYDSVTKTVCYDNIEVPTLILSQLRSANNKNQNVSINDLIDVVEESADAIMSAMNRKNIEVRKVTTGKGFNDLRKELENKFGKPEEAIAQNRNYLGYTDANSWQYVIKTYDKVTDKFAKNISMKADEILKDVQEIEEQLDGNCNL